MEAWSAALPEVRAAYPGLLLTPQLGLVPIGPDPTSHLWEFAHLETGEPAVRGADGKLILTETTGLVFVLLPGGTFQMALGEPQRQHAVERRQQPRPPSRQDISTARSPRPPQGDPDAALRDVQTRFPRRLPNRPNSTAQAES